MALTTNPNYLVEITSNLRLAGGSQPVSIVANLPETFGISVSSQWDAAMSGSIGSAIESGLAGAAGVAGGTAGTALGLTGGATRTAGSLLNAEAVVQYLTRQRWLGSSPIEFDLPLLFDAEIDTITETLKPITVLKALCMPYAQKVDNVVLLFPPGETLFNQQGKIDLRIGRLAFFDSVIITSVRDMIHNRMDKVNGLPISVDCEVTFRTTTTPSRDDMLRWFGDVGTTRTSGDSVQGGF